MALSPNVKLMEKVRLRMERKLTVPGDVLVKPGQRVSPDTVIAKAEYVRGEPYVVDLKSEISGIEVTPEIVDKVLLKKVGDKVEVREVIAKFQKSFWSPVIEVKSPCTGTIEYISRVQARVIIREDPRSAKPMAIVAAAAKLGVWPKLLRMYTEVKEGDQVFEGKIIAAAPGVGTTDYVYAPMSGVVQKICTQTGTIVIVRPIKPTQVTAHVTGVVREIIDDYGAIVESTGAYLEGVFGVGGEKYGELAVCTTSPEDVLDEAGIPSDIKGRVVVAGSLVTLEAVQKARKLGAVGIITGGINNLDLVQMLGKEIVVGITGQEDDLDITVVVTEGFGPMPMNLKTWELLRRNEGKVASIDGTTQIRAGVIRPRVFVNGGGGDETDIPHMDDRKLESAVPGLERPLQVGDRVRCLRAPYAGLWGVVEEIPEEPKTVECESLMEVASVRLEDGRLVTVPEANLEVFNDDAAS